MFKKFHRLKLVNRIFFVIGGIAAGAAFAFLLGLIVMLLWNWLMPMIFSLPKITYIQAWGLVLLSHLLFKAGPHNHPPIGPHAKWKERFHEKIMGHKYSHKLSDEESAVKS